MESPLKIAFFTINNVRKVPSRNIVQIVAEMDVDNFKALADFDETAGVFIPAGFDIAEGVYSLPIDRLEMRELIQTSVGGLVPDAHSLPPKGGASPSGRPSLARLLHARGYFNNPKLWQKMEEAGIYTQEQHYEAVKAMDPINVYPTIQGKGDVVAHHTRDASNSGTGIKPDDFYTIPIYQTHHVHLHNHATAPEREEHIRMVVAITAAAMKDAMKRFMGRDSLAGLTKDELDEFEAHIGLNSGIAFNGNQTLHSRGV